MEKECENIWLCCDGGVEELIYPDEIMEFWANNSSSTVALPMPNNYEDNI